LSRIQERVNALKDTAAEDHRRKEAVQTAEFEASLVAKQREREALRKERWVDSSCTISDEHRQEIARIREMEQRQEQEEQQRAREESFRRRAGLFHENAAATARNSGAGATSSENSASARHSEAPEFVPRSPKMGEVDTTRHALRQWHPLLLCEGGCRYTGPQDHRSLLGDPNTLHTAHTTHTTPLTSTPTLLRRSVTWPTWRGCTGRL